MKVHKNGQIQGQTAKILIESPGYGKLVWELPAYLQDILGHIPRDMSKLFLGYVTLILRARVICMIANLLIEVESGEWIHTAKEVNQESKKKLLRIVEKIKPR